MDDEGVRTRETKLVEHGILRTLLTTRVPVRGIPRSTGSRRGAGADVTNVFVSSDSGLTDAQLRRRLLAVAAGRGSPYAIVVRRLGGGGTGSGSGLRALVAAMRISGMGGAFPLADAVKLFPDGHEEPIRGATLSGLSTASFKEIVAASRSRAVVTLPSRGRFPGSMSFAFGGGTSMRRGFLFGFHSPTATYVMPSLLFEEAAVRRPSEDGAPPPALKPPWTSPN